MKFRARIASLAVGLLTTAGAFAAVAAPQAHAATPFYMQAQYNQPYHIEDPNATSGTQLTLPNTALTVSDEWVSEPSQNSGYASQGYSQLVNQATGLCADNQNGGSGTAIIAHTCTGAYAQAVKQVSVSGVSGVAWQFISGLRIDNGSHLVRVWTANNTTSQAWFDNPVGSSPSPQYFGLGASQTNVQSNGYDGVYPLSDSYCSARVQPFAERVSANTTANNDVPVAGTNFSWGPWAAADYNTVPETQYNLNHVTGNVPANFTTDEILEWAACKWGMDQNIAKAEAVSESSWHQSNQGDFGCGHYDSFGILQVKATNPNDCSSYNTGWGGYPWIKDSTAVNADAQMARLRAVYDGQSYMGAGGNGSPALTGGTSTAVGAPIWNVVSTWQSGSNTGPDSYTSEIQNCLSTQCWTGVS